MDRRWFVVAGVHGVRLDAVALDAAFLHIFLVVEGLPTFGNIVLLSPVLTLPGRVGADVTDNLVHQDNVRTFLSRYGWQHLISSG